MTKGVLLFLRIENFFFFFFLERVRGCKGGTVAKAHVPETSPRMAWTSASKTKVLVRPGCLHSWAVFWDSMGGEEDIEVSASVW